MKPNSTFQNFSFYPIFGLVVALLLLPYQGQAAETNLSKTAEIEIKLVSFNILGGDGTGGSADGRTGTGQNAWSSRRDLVAELLRKQAPDVVSLQKGGRNSIDDLRKAIPAFGEIGVGRDDGKNAGEFVAILYATNRWSADESGTFWLSETPETAGSRGWGASSARICTWARFTDRKSNFSFYVFNTHLDPGAAASRDNGAALILARIAARKHPDPFVITGDMNSPETSSTIRIYKTGVLPVADPVTSPAVPLQDCFRVLHADATDVRTRHQFTGSTQGDKVDYILVPDSWKVMESSILHDATNGQYPSDHFPVAATLHLRSAP